jgi:ribosome-binding factor A
MVNQTRARRIADRIAEELSDLLFKEVKDPRLDGVTITDVEVDRELAYATVYFTALNAPSRLDEIQAGFQHASGFLRSQLATRIPLRSFPRLRFRYDPSQDRGARIDELLREISRGEEGAGDEEA